MGSGASPEKVSVEFPALNCKEVSPRVDLNVAVLSRTKNRPQNSLFCYTYICTFMGISYRGKVSRQDTTDVNSIISESYFSCRQNTEIHAKHKNKHGRRQNIGSQVRLLLSSYWIPEKMANLNQNVL